MLTTAGGWLGRCISVGTRKGYSVTNCDPFGRVYTMSECVSGGCSDGLWIDVHRRRRAGDRGDAVLHVAHRARRRGGPTAVEPAKAADCQHQGTSILWLRISRWLTVPQRQSMICELLFPSAILAVKLNRKSLVIVLEMEIYIYDISNMRLLHVIETTPNPDGTSPNPPHNHY